MPIGVFYLQIHLPYAQSLKDRRQVVRSLKDRLRQHFNVSVAEISAEDPTWQRATLGVAAIAGDRVYLEGLLQQATHAALAALGGQEVTVSPTEILE